MSKDSTEKTPETDWERLASMTDADIDTSDIPELDETFFQQAKVVMPENKQAISIRLDADVLEWFRLKGRGYQTHINAVLRAYVDAQ